jgi:hypothetical protein
MPLKGFSFSGIFDRSQRGTPLLFGAPKEDKKNGQGSGREEGREEESSEEPQGEASGKEVQEKQSLR